MDVSQLPKFYRSGQRRRHQRVGVNIWRRHFYFCHSIARVAEGYARPGGRLCPRYRGNRPTDGKAGNYIVIAVGHGRPGTVTAGWEYDYRAELAYHWQNGVNQIPALVGSVIRAKAHDGGA